MPVSSMHPSPTVDLPVRTKTSTSSKSMSKQGVFGSLKSKLSRKSDSSESRITPEIRQPRAVNRVYDGDLLLPASQPTRRPNRPGMNAFTTPSNEPPPAYTPSAQSGSSSSAMRSSSVARSTHSIAPSVTSTADDPYAFLTSFDTIFLIDDSGSMAGRSWRETGGALETIAPICTAHDEDGIDIYFLNAPDQPHFRGIKSPATVREIFQTVRPQRGTPTGQRLHKILRPYLREYEARPEATKPLNIIVITDGEPSDDVESVIISAAKKLDRLDAPAWQVGIQFFQVGKEPGAKEHLRQLDDELAELANDEDLRDMVDTVPYTGSGDEPLNGEGILKIVLGAVNRRLDRKKSKDLHRPLN